MSWIKPASLDAARHHAARIAARFEKVGIASTTLDRVIAALGAELVENPGTGWLVVPPGVADQLRHDAMQIEVLLSKRHDSDLGGVDLARLRYILAEEVVG